MINLVRKFWWGQSNEKNKTAWMSWDKMYIPKDEGGLGFQDVKTFNLALLAKQGWRLQTCMNSLVHRVLKSHYFPNGDFLSVQLGNNPSPTWRSIMSTQSMVQHDIHWQVGNGQSINVCNDKWLNQPSIFWLTFRPIMVPTNAKLSTFIDPSTVA